LSTKLNNIFMLWRRCRSAGTC